MFFGGGLGWWLFVVAGVGSLVIISTGVDVGGVDNKSSHLWRGYDHEVCFFL